MKPLPRMLAVSGSRILESWIKMKTLIYTQVHLRTCVKERVTFRTWISGQASSFHVWSTWVTNLGFVLYPMVGVRISGEKGCWGNHNFPSLSDHFHWSFNKSKNWYPLRNHIIPTLATARAPGTMRPQAKQFLGPQQLLIWDTCDFSMGMGSWYNLQDLPLWNMISVLTLGSAMLW